MALNVSAKHVSILSKKRPKSTQNIKSIRIISWNIWFDSYRMKKRMNEIMSIVSENQCDIFCFQEVTKQSFKYISEHKYTKDCYISCKNINDIGQYGNIIFSKFPISQTNVLKYKFSDMSRRLVTADIDINNQLFKICTTHLESLENYRPQRVSQLNESVKYILNQYNNNNNKVDHFIYCGDFNECGTINDNLLPFPDKQFKDCWVDYYNGYIDDEYKQINPGWTMPEIGKYKAWRPDRIYYAFNYDFNKNSYKQYIFDDKKNNQLKQDDNIPLFSLDNLDKNEYLIKDIKNKKDCDEQKIYIAQNMEDKSNLFGSCSLKSIQRIGMENIQLSNDEELDENNHYENNTLTPSDHYGLIAEFQFIDTI